ncbi:MAG: hypothetical protein U5R30_09485 [Deltaproteobacteria bacterium]|nr:hypothetical protein [Deltaproteobacteria bacterium]
MPGDLSGTICSGIYYRFLNDLSGLRLHQQNIAEDAPKCGDILFPNRGTAIFIWMSSFVFAGVSALSALGTLKARKILRENQWLAGIVVYMSSKATGANRRQVEDIICNIYGDYKWLVSD